MREFRRSATFGIAGVLVVMAAVLVIGLSADPTDPDPKGTFAAIFGVVGAYVVVLFVLQALDLRRAEGKSVAAPAIPQAGVENPATMEEPQLWASMAVAPITKQALQARRRMWGVARRSMSMGWLVTALIFLSVPPIYLLDTWVPFIIGTPVIVGIALWKSVLLLAGRGDLGEAYELSGEAMKPLGLAIVEKPEIHIEPKGVAPFRLGPGLHGALVLEGTRHDRYVGVRMPAGEGVRSKSQVLVGAAAPEFEFKSRDGRLRAADGAPASAASALDSVPNSTRWKGVKGRAGPEGISVERTGSGSGDWLLDLWLAERLADRLA